jgi:hypothetical protein
MTTLYEKIEFGVRNYNRYWRGINDNRMFLTPWYSSKPKEFQIFIHNSLVHANELRIIFELK